MVCIYVLTEGKIAYYTLLILMFVSVKFHQGIFVIADFKQVRDMMDILIWLQYAVTLQQEHMEMTV